MKASISIFGLGYVGSVTAACLAHAGHSVVGVDVSAAKVALVNSGRSPIVEAGMNELIAEAHSAARLRATTDAFDAVNNSTVSFVCVGTPSLRSGKLDLSHIEKVSREIGVALRGKQSGHIVVLRSTVLPGTTESLMVPILQEESGRRAGHDLTVCYNPEFMREGSAVADYLEPPYTILGARDVQHLAPLREIYGGISGPVCETSIPVAEMVKYVSNCYHALKVGFANEIGTLCKHLGVDTQAVTQIFTSDTKLNVSAAYLSPGFAFGGSCLPKDLRAITHKAKELDLKVPLLDSILPSNAEHVDRAVESILATGKRKVAQLGLSFKAGTDDLRESPQVQLIKRLLGEGLEIKVWDEDVSLGKLAGSNRQYIEEVIPHIGSVLSSDLEAVLKGAEIVILGNKAATRERLTNHLCPEQIVLDLVHLNVGQRPSGVNTYEGICW